LREAQAAAVMNHPNIVPVYEACSEGGFTYIAAEFCPGPTLSQWLLHHGRPVEPSAAAALVAACADAMGYAHRRRVIHRDLKPSNILLDVPPDPIRGGQYRVPGDETPEETEALKRLDLIDYVPRVTDFGFAKLLENSDDATRTGTVIGTPLYMAPEQAEGKLELTGPATDIYALGVILYEMLSGRVPLKGPTDAATLRMVVTNEPELLRNVNPNIPRDLAAVVHKCLRKEPGQRYASGDALAADLWRFLGKEPTYARPVGIVETAWKWTRRNPALAATMTTAVLALSGLFTLELRYRREVTQANAELSQSLDREKATTHLIDQQRQLVQDRSRAERRAAYLAEMRYLGTRALAGRIAETDLRRWNHDEEQTEDLRGFEWYYLAQLGQSHKVWQDFDGPLRRIAPDATGRTIAALTTKGLSVWDGLTGEERRRIPGGATIHSARFFPDGRSLGVWRVAPDHPHHVALEMIDLQTGSITNSFP
ncbi:MAG: protein kinase domain-containing protein, partial [Gemmataceae bacterium]